MITTVDACKAFRGIPDENVDHDAELGRIIAAVQDWLEMECGRTFDRGELTEYYSGSDWSSILILGRPPIISITNLYDDMSRVFSAPIDPARYVVTDANAGVLQLDGLTFSRGIKNIKVVYIGGYEDIPKDLEQAAIELVWAARMKGEQSLVGVRSRSIADGSVQFVNLDWGSPALAAVIDKYKLKTGVA